MKPFGFIVEGQKVTLYFYNQVRGVSGGGVGLLILDYKPINVQFMDGAERYVMTTRAKALGVGGLGEPAEVEEQAPCLVKRGGANRSLRKEGEAVLQSVFAWQREIREVSACYADNSRMGGRGHTQSMEEIYLGGSLRKEKTK